MARTAPAQSFLEKLKAQMEQGVVQRDVTGRPPERLNQVVETNRFDRWEFKKARRSDAIDELVTDLAIGDEAKGGERAPFDQAPELVEAIFHLFHKTSPTILPARAIKRELRVARRITEEMKENPRLTDLHEYTATDPTMSIMAVDAMGDALREILMRKGSSEPPQPKTNPNGPTPPGGQPGPGGGGGQGGGQPGPGGGGGPSQPGQGQQPGGGGQPGQPDPNASQQPPQPGGGGGQPDPNQGGQPGGTGPDEGGDEGQGPPPPPEEKDAEQQEEEANEDEDLTEGDNSEFDPEADWEAQEADWERQFDELMDEIDLDRLTNRALEKAYRDVAEVEALRKGIGLEDGVWATMDPTERLAMVKQLQTPEMRALADIVGRMRRFSLGARMTRVNDVPHEIYDVGLGRDIRHVLKSEFAYLANEDTAIEFYRKYAEGELLTYKLHGSEDVGKGPIVACVDKSGSMNGQPFRWALAVCEALRRFALEDDRDMIVMFFGNNRDRVKFTFPKGRAEFKEVLAFMGTVANGGTEFDGVLTEALEKATNAFDGEGRGKADILFITDGQARLNDQWIADFNAERERVGVRVFSVFIGGASDMARGTGPLGLLGKISDATIPVRDLQPEEVKAVFERV